MPHPLRLASVLAFLAFPILEIGVLIRVGQAIGFWKLALIVVATAMLGSAVIRRTGLSVLTRARAQMESGGHAFAPMFDGLVQLTAGMLLIFPGLLSDLLGLILLVPPVRDLIVKWLLPALFPVSGGSARSGRSPFETKADHDLGAGHPRGADDAGGVTIEGEYERVAEERVKEDRALRRRST